MRQPLRPSFFIQANLDTPADNRLDAKYTQFRGFLQGIIHAFTAGYGLHQGDFQSRLILRCTAVGQLYGNTLAVHFSYLPGIVLSISVEQDQGVACRQPQHTRQVVNDRARQLDIAGW
jgi:hypothetical protein